MREHEIIDSDGVFTLNTVTMELKNTGTKKSVVQFSHNCERITFSFPRIVEGHDLSLCDKVQIHYNNIEVKTKRQSKDIFEAADLRIDPEDAEKILFSWLIAGNATKYQGSLNFIVVCKCLDGTDAGYRLPTKTHKKLTVAESMDNSEAVMEEYADLLESWRAEVLAEIEMAEDACLEAIELAGAEQLTHIGSAGQGQLAAITAAGESVLDEMEEKRTLVDGAAEKAEAEAERAETAAANAVEAAEGAANAAEFADGAAQDAALRANAAAESADDAEAAAKRSEDAARGMEGIRDQAASSAYAAADSAHEAEKSAEEAKEAAEQASGGITVDAALDDSSTNPVQNKVVKQALDDKLGKIANERGTTGAYVVDTHGNHYLAPVNEGEVSFSIPVRNHDGCIYANHPTENNHVATKRYVDDHAGEQTVMNGTITKAGCYLAHFPNGTAFTISIWDATTSAIENHISHLYMPTNDGYLGYTKYEVSYDGNGSVAVTSYFGGFYGENDTRNFEQFSNQYNADKLKCLLEY